VIAIALTLLVLQLRVPTLSQVVDPDSAADLAAQLGKGSAELVSYGISFYVIAQFWLVHRQIFRLIGDQEEGLGWWNFAFLFTITIMPFTSTLLGAFVSNPLAVDIFALNLLLASLATQAMIVVGRRTVTELRRVESGNEEPYQRLMSREAIRRAAVGHVKQTPHVDLEKDGDGRWSERVLPPLT
jgi:uncharacterized membrane protein